MVHLKDFSLLSVDIQSGDVFKAIETAIPAEAIHQAISLPKLKRNACDRAPAQLVVSQVNCNESLVKRLIAERAEILG